MWLMQWLMMILPGYQSSNTLHFVYSQASSGWLLQVFMFPFRHFKFSTFRSLVNRDQIPKSSSWVLSDAMRCMIDAAPIRACSCSGAEKLRSAGVVITHLC
jgi:hypothetical protein